MDRMFEKKLNHDFSYFAFRKEPLGARANGMDFHKHLSIAVKVESVHNLDKVKNKQFFLI